MSNMSYCRFQNTYHDFNDCCIALQSMDGEEDNKLSASELVFAKRLACLALEMIEYLTEGEEPTAELLIEALHALASPDSWCWHEPVDGNWTTRATGFIDSEKAQAWGEEHGERNDRGFLTGGFYRAS